MLCQFAEDSDNIIVNFNGGLGTPQHYVGTNSSRRNISRQVRVIQQTINTFSCNTTQIKFVGINIQNFSRRNLLFGSQFNSRLAHHRHLTFTIADGGLINVVVTFGIYYVYVTGCRIAVISIWSGATSSFNSFEHSTGSSPVTFPAFAKNSASISRCGQNPYNSGVNISGQYRRNTDVRCGDSGIFCNKFFSGIKHNACIVHSLA